MTDQSKTSPLLQWLSSGLLITDGAWGTELQARGLRPGANPDTWNLTHPDRLKSVARAYAEAGSQVILTNTFRANAVAMHATQKPILTPSTAPASQSRAAPPARRWSSPPSAPPAKCSSPARSAAEQVAAAFAAQALSLAAAGADALLIETMSDIEEARLAVAGRKKPPACPSSHPSPSTPAKTRTAP